MKKAIFVICLLGISTLLATAEPTVYRCTETWNGHTVERDCAGSQSSCETCFLTGSGCSVTCEEKPSIQGLGG